MRKVQSRWAQGRRTILSVAVVAAGLTIVPLSQALAQDAATQQPAPAQPPGLTLEGDAGLIFTQVKPDKTADFEEAMAKVHEALQKSDKPERKQQAAGWKLYKSADPGPGGNAFYITVVMPTVKDADYNIGKILYEVFPSEAQAIFNKYRDSVAGGLSRVNLKVVQDMSAPAAPSAGAPSTPSPAPAQTPTPPQQ